MRGVGGEQQLQRLVGHRGACADQPAAADHIGAALLAKVIAAQGAALAVLAVVGGHAHAGEDKALRLAQLGACAVEVDLFDVGQPQRGDPTDQTLVLGHGGRLGAQQCIAVAQGRERLIEIGRAVIRLGVGHWLVAQVEQRVVGDQPGLGFGTFQRGLQPRR